MSDVLDDSFLNYILNDFDDESADLLPSADLFPSNRFASTSHEELEKLRRNRIPKATLEKVKWAVNIFSSWLYQWKISLDEGLRVYKDMDQMERSDLNFCLKYFIADVRKINGEEYPPRTLKEIVAAVQHHFNYALRKPFSIFKDVAFLETREILDAAMKRSAQNGTVKPKKRAAPISVDAEEKLWSNGVFGRGNPRQVIDTLIYHFGMHFALRARQEHRDLTYGTKSQICIERDSNGQERLKYVERVSKNKSFGINNSRKEPKITYIYAHPDKARCIVELYKFYVSHRPENHSMPGNEAFYLTPIPKPKSDVWFKNTPMGIHTIAGTISRLMGCIDDKEFYSNTSLRRTAKTRMVEGGISKEIAVRKTGHASNADLTYVDASGSEERMCRVIYGEKRQEETESVSGVTESVSCKESTNQKQLVSKHVKMTQKETVSVSEVIESDSAKETTNQRELVPKHVKITCGAFTFEANF